MTARADTGAVRSAEAWYAALGNPGAGRKTVHALLARRDWIHHAGEFDERTGELLPNALSHVCSRLHAIGIDAKSAIPRDRLHRIVEHVHRPLLEILRQPHERLVREHASLPLRAVRELDSTSFFALSRRSGRTIREKLADRPYLWALERRWTVDTAENRLVKALCVRLVQLLQRRREAWQQPDEEWLGDLIARIESWLQSTVSKQIGRWENLPPNNLLLQHRDYRRVWDAWGWTETLAADMQRDDEQRLAQWTTIAFWSLVAELAACEGVRLLEQPCYLGYEDFSVAPARGSNGALICIEGLLAAKGGPHVFRLEMNQRSHILLTPPSGAPIEVTGQIHGESVQAQIGSTAIGVGQSPQGAFEVGSRLLVSAFPETRRTLTNSTGTVLPKPAATGAMRVVDLCSLRPRYADSDRHGILPFRLLWQRWHPSGRDPVEIDLGVATAIALGGELDSVSILDLLAAESHSPPTVLSLAARSFAKGLAAALGGDALRYIVPDGTDEFVLGTLRRNINASFSAAEPLPRSIAAVFAWQGTDGFTKRRISAGDCVLVLDTVGDVLSATPLLARKSKELALRVPESGGIYWERSPCLQAGPQCTSREAAVAVLKQLGCSFPEEVARLCGFQGLLDEGSDVSWQNDAGVWFTAPDNHQATIQQALARTVDPWAQLSRAITHELGRLLGEGRLFLLLAGDIFQEGGRKICAPRFDLRCDVIELGYVSAPHFGGMVLHRWQERAGEIPLWRDHLPELSMRIIEDGRQARFSLVNQNVTVEPKRGKAVSIDIDQHFVLPAGLQDYQFPLLQGSDGNELRYEAFLSSPAFPLKADLRVELRLTYAYGTDTPYSLVFIPRSPGPAGMGPIRAEWRLRPEAAELPSHYPMLPAPETWDKFRQYPKRDSVETSDLIEWIQTQLEKMPVRTRALVAKRHIGIAQTGWRIDRQGQKYVFANCELGSVFCHQGYFLFEEDLAPIAPGTQLSLELENGPKGLAGRSIAVIRPADSWREVRVLERKVWNVCDRLKKGLRFPMLTVWCDGHSLDDPQVPSRFRQFVSTGSEQLLMLLNVRAPAKWPAGKAECFERLSDEALFLLCCLHKDAPAAVAQRLRSLLPQEGPSMENLRRYWRHVALALGACQLPWQRELLHSVLSQLRQEPIQLDACIFCLRVLSVALWRCAAVFEVLTPPDLLMIVDRTDNILKEDLARLFENPCGIDAEILKDHLELVLALLRTRASGEAGIRGVLAPGRPAAKSLARTIEQIVDVVSAHDILINSRITLAIDKPQALHRTPDILYALKLYLTGDAGARAIRVMEVKEDEA